MRITSWKKSIQVKRRNIRNNVQIFVCFYLSFHAGYYRDHHWLLDKLEGGKLPDVRGEMHARLMNGAQIVSDPVLGEVVSLDGAEEWIQLGDFKGDFRSFVRLFVCSFVHSFVRSFVRSLSRSFVRSLVRSLVCSLVRSYVRSLVRSFVRSFSRSFARSFVCSFVRSLARSLVRSFARSLVRSFVLFSVWLCRHSYRLL